MNIYLQILILIILMFSVVLIHELGHYFAKVFYKIPVTQVILGIGMEILRFNYNGTDFIFNALLTGGKCVSKGERSDYSPIVNINILLAGAGANILFAFITIVFSYFIGSNILILAFIEMNIVFGIVNLIPFFKHSDGNQAFIIFKDTLKDKKSFR